MVTIAFLYFSFVKPLYFETLPIPLFNINPPSCNFFCNLPFRTMIFIALSSYIQHKSERKAADLKHYYFQVTATELELTIT